MSKYAKPLPLADLDTQEYWNGTKRRELQAQHCSNCAALRWPPQPFCPHCQSFDFRWTTLRQTGTVQSYVVVHQATARAFAGDVPYTIARIAIDDTNGMVIVTSNLEDVDWEQVTVGMQVEAHFDDVTRDVTLLRFHPAR